MRKVHEPMVHLSIPFSQAKLLVLGLDTIRRDTRYSDDLRLAVQATQDSVNTAMLRSLRAWTRPLAIQLRRLLGRAPRGKGVVINVRV